MSRIESLRDLPISADTLAENPESGGRDADRDAVEVPQCPDGRSWHDIRERQGSGRRRRPDPSREAEEGLRTAPSGRLPASWKESHTGPMRFTAKSRTGVCNWWSKTSKGTPTEGFKVRARAFEAHYGIKITVE